MTQVEAPQVYGVFTPTFLSSKTNVVNLSWLLVPMLEGGEWGVLLSKAMGNVSNIYRRALASANIHGFKLTWWPLATQTKKRRDATADIKVKSPPFDLRFQQEVCVAVSC